MKCKHDFKTLQQQVVSDKVYVDGLIQCKRCKSCFVFGTKGPEEEEIYLKPIKTMEETKK